MLRILILAVVGSVTGGLFLLWLTGERWRLLRKSTWDNIKAHGWKDMLNFKALHAYVYARWTKEYIYVLRNIIFPRLDERGRKKWTDTYHGKVITHELARAVITLNRNIPLRDLEQVIPYPTARDLVLNGPPDVVAYECCCRKSSGNHCSPSQVCLTIGKPFTDFVLEHHPKISRRLNQAEALELLRQEHERGHMHTAWFKDINLNRFYAICNCCKCCCTGTEAMLKYGAAMLAPSGYVASVNASRCEACGTCEKVCHFNAVHANGKGAASVQWERCMGCGVCEVKCPNKAMTLVRDERKGIPFDVRVMV